MVEFSGSASPLEWVPAPFLHPFCDFLALQSSLHNNSIGKTLKRDSTRAFLATLVVCFINNNSHRSRTAAASEKSCKSQPQKILPARFPPCICDDQVEEGYRYPSPPSEPYLRLSPHTAQASHMQPSPCPTDSSRSAAVLPWRSWACRCWWQYKCTNSRLAYASVPPMTRGCLWWRRSSSPLKSSMPQTGQTQSCRSASFTSLALRCRRLIRRRDHQYSRRRGSSGEAVPRTRMWRTILNQPNFSR